MELPSVGSIIFVPFPYADFSRVKNRPVLVLAASEQSNIIVCQITSKPYSSARAISLNQTDFKRGGLPLRSYARIDKLWTLEASLVLGTLGELRTAKRAMALEAARKLFTEL